MVDETRSRVTAAVSDAGQAGLREVVRVAHAGLHPWVHAEVPQTGLPQPMDQGDLRLERSRWASVSRPRPAAAVRYRRGR